MVIIGSVTVGAGGTSEISFTSIPGTYTDLCLKASIRSSGSTGTYDAVKFKINTSSSNISVKNTYGTGTSVGSESPGTTDSNVFAYTSNSNNTTNTFGSLEFYIPNYTSTSYAKSISVNNVSETNGSGSILTITSVLWNPGTQTAINSLSITPYLGGSTFVQNSTAYLYGIKNS